MLKFKRKFRRQRVNFLPVNGYGIPETALVRSKIWMVLGGGNKTEGRAGSSTCSFTINATQCHTLDRTQERNGGVQPPELYVPSLIKVSALMSFLPALCTNPRSKTPSAFVHLSLRDTKFRTHKKQVNF